MNGRIKILSDKKIWIINFCYFQYGELIRENKKNKPHQSYMKLLEKHRQWQDYLYSIHRDKEKDKDKDKDLEKKKLIDKELEKDKEIENDQEEEFSLDISDEEIVTDKGERDGISDTNTVRDKKYWEARVNKLFNDET